MKKDIIKIKIRCSSEKCERLREAGLFFQAIADTLDIDRDDVEELEEVDNRTKINNSRRQEQHDKS